MSNYSTLKADIINDIKQNGSNAITGQLLQDNLIAMVNSLGAGYQCLGVADLNTPSSSPDYKCFYIVSEAGTYNNFPDANNDPLVVNDGEVCLFKWDSAWSKVVTGAATSAKVNQLGQEVDGLFKETENDFAITDESGNNIVQFAGGNIKTKEFDSTTDIQKVDESEFDFAITDVSRNNIVQFAGGNIKTKEFDSTGVNKSLKLRHRTIYALNMAERTDIVANNWVVSNNRISNNGNYGWDNKLYLNREIDISDKIFIYDLAVEQGAIAYFGTVGSQYGTTNEKQSLFSVNFPAGTINIHNYIPVPYSLPNVFMSKSFDATNYVSKKYRVVLSRGHRILKIVLYDITTSPTFIAQLEYGMSGNGSVVGLMYDKPMCFSSGANLYLYNLVVNIPTSATNECYVLIEGDSITEGWTVDEEQSYGFLFANEFPDCLVKVSGRGNGDSRNLLNRLSGEAQYMNPEYVMVTIGTNDGNSLTTSRIQAIVDYVCDTMKKKLILNHIPRNAGDTSSYVNGIIDTVIANNPTKGIMCVRFDVATSIDYDLSLGMDTSLFSDTAHPNVAGNLRMYQQIIVDCPELFNF